MMYRKFKRFNLVIALTILSYITIGYGAWLKSGTEIFPFFSWDLFSTIPQPVGMDYALRLLSVENQGLTPPLYFEQTAQWFARANAVEAQVVIQNLAQAIVTGNQEQITEWRTLLEKNYLNDRGSGQYEIVQRRFDLLDRWRTNRFIEETILGSFEWERNQP